MNILLLDNEETKFQLEQLNKILKYNWNILCFNNIGESKISYKNNDIDLVIINFDIQENHKFLETIISKKPQQKIITISTTLVCSTLLGCDYCIENLNKRRILKPIDIKELNETIVHFDNIHCQYSDGFQDIKEYLPKVLQQYNSCRYDINNKIIECSNKNISEFLKVIDMLKMYNVKFTTNECTIQLDNL